MSATAAECAMGHAAPRLTQELWTSFVSLLRSHVAMRSIARPSAGHAVASASDKEIEIAAPNTGLRISAPGASGIGSIEWNGGDHQHFFFTEDGWIEFIQSGTKLLPSTEPLPPMDMESAVEHLLDRVCR